MRDNGKASGAGGVVLNEQEKPAAHRNHPINAVLRDGETFKELAKRVEYCEITWPQCIVWGEPIRLKSATS